MIGNIALFYRPVVTLAGGRYLLFDIGGAILIAGMGLMLVAASVRHTIALYRAERLPDVSPPDADFEGRAHCRRRQHRSAP